MTTLGVGDQTVNYVARRRAARHFERAAFVLSCSQFACDDDVRTGVSLEALIASLGFSTRVDASSLGATALGALRRN